jgi:hypothetical protein
MFGDWTHEPRETEVALVETPATTGGGGRREGGRTDFAWRPPWLEEASGAPSELCHGICLTTKENRGKLHLEKQNGVEPNRCVSLALIQYVTKVPGLWV